MQYFVSSPMFFSNQRSPFDTERGDCSFGLGHKAFPHLEELSYPIRKFNPMTTMKIEFCKRVTV
jgi:hypothetical protein